MKAVQPSNREHAVATAAQLFLQSGYAHTSMDDVMRESRVSKSNIYYHFKSKEELLLAVVEYWADKYGTALSELMDRKGSSVEGRMTDFLRVLAEGFEARKGGGGCPFISLYVQSPGQASEVRARIARFFAELKPELQQFFLQGIEAGEFRAGIDAAEVSTLFLTTLEGALVLAETTADASLITQSGRSFFNLISRGPQ